MPAPTPRSPPAQKTSPSPPPPGERDQAQARPVYRGKEDRRRRRSSEQLVTSSETPASPTTTPGAELLEAPGPSSPTAPETPASPALPHVELSGATSSTSSAAAPGVELSRSATSSKRASTAPSAPAPPQAPEPPAPGEDEAAPPGEPPDDGEPPGDSPPDPTPSAPQAYAALSAADVAADLRAQLTELEHEAVALADEQAGLCAELQTLTQDVRSGALKSEPAKVITASLRAILGNAKDRAALTAARARELRDRLQRYEALELVRFAPGVNPHTATLDAVLRGEAPATVGERLAAARLSSLSEVVKTDDDPAAALLTWTGTVWAAAEGVEGL